MLPSEPPKPPVVVVVAPDVEDCCVDAPVDAASAVLCAELAPGAPPDPRLPDDAATPEAPCGEDSVEAVLSPQAAAIRAKGEREPDAIEGNQGSAPQPVRTTMCAVHGK